MVEFINNYIVKFATQNLYLVRYEEHNFARSSHVSPEFYSKLVGACTKECHIVVTATTSQGQQHLGQIHSARWLLLTRYQHLSWLFLPENKRTSDTTTITVFLHHSSSSSSGSFLVFFLSFPLLFSYTFWSDLFFCQFLLRAVFSRTLYAIISISLAFFVTLPWMNCDRLVCSISQHRAACDHMICIALGWRISTDTAAVCGYTDDQMMIYMSLGRKNGFLLLVHKVLD